MEKDIVDVRPEFFEHKCSAIEAHVQQPELACLGPGTVHRGVIKIGNARCSAGTRNLRNIECSVSGIGARYEHAAECICRALDESPMSQRVVAGVLMQCGREKNST